MLLEGYDFTLRAYVLRKAGDDRVRLTMTPTAAQLNPVFLITGWTAPSVRVYLDGEEMGSDRFQAQLGADGLTVWVAGHFATSIEFAFMA